MFYLNPSLGTTADYHCRKNIKFQFKLNLYIQCIYFKVSQISCQKISWKNLKVSNNVTADAAKKRKKKDIPIKSLCELKRKRYKKKVKIIRKINKLFTQIFTSYSKRNLASMKTICYRCWSLTIGQFTRVSSLKRLLQN